MNDKERHALAKAIFLDALLLDPASRADLLGQRCAGDPELRAEVEDLLHHASGPPPTGFAPGTAGELSSHGLATGALYAGRYRIVTLLGSGAMGDVYRAVDETLDVEIALKVLRRSSPALVERLLDEVRLARQVTHPAICRVYDVDHVGDEYFFTMELVDGENLKTLLARIGRLPGEKVRDVGVQICEGLAAAHERGVLHRDLKPSNIMLDGSGAIRVTDFGVATSTLTTESEPLAGTVAYMAPELLAGEPASVRSDLYAVGLVLYEALVGKATEAGIDSHEGATPAEPSAILPSVDPDLDDVVMSLLSRDPANRPATAAEVAKQLRRVDVVEPAAPRRYRRVLAALGILALMVGAVAVTWLYAQPRPLALPPTTELLSDVARAPAARNALTIAVLPLADASNDKARGDVAECLQDDLIERLSRVAGVEVIGEDSADRIRDPNDVKAVGRSLGASFVVAGDVANGANGLHLTVNLFDTRSGKRVWSESYDHAATPNEIHDTERRIVARTVESVVHDAPPIPEGNAPTNDDTAYALYLKGRQKVPPFTAAEFHASSAALTEAIAHDPQFASANAALATAYATASVFRWIDAASGFATARRYAERAVELEPLLDEPHVVLATVAAEYDWNWTAAEEAFREAIRLNPSSAWAQRTYARYLSSRGRFDEALVATGRAAELDPTSAIMLQGAAQRLYEARRFDRAQAVARIAIRLEPLYVPSYVTLGWTLIAQGRYPEAVEQLRKAVDVGGRDATSLARVAYAQSLAGETAEAAATAAEAQRIGEPDAAERALLAMARGDPDAAVAALAHAVEQHEPPSIWLAVSPLFDPLRQNSAFARLAERVGGASSAASAPSNSALF